MGWGNLVSTHKSWIKDTLKAIKDNPSRLITGVDPVSTKVWNTILNKDDKPIVNVAGGPTGDSLDKAGASQGTRNWFKVADTVASIWGLAGAASALSGAAGAGGGAAEGGGSAVAEGASGASSGAGWASKIGQVGNAFKAMGQGMQGGGGGSMPAERLDASYQGGGDMLGRLQSFADQYNTNEGAMNDGHRIQIYQGDGQPVARLIDGDGNIVGARPLDESSADDLAARIQRMGG